MSKTLVVYTKCFGLDPFMIVFDSTNNPDNCSPFTSADFYDHDGGESVVKILSVSDGVTNEDVLKFLNNTMELATDRQMRKFKRLEETREMSRKTLESLNRGLADAKSGAIVPDPRKKKNRKRR